jgi:dipeptidyl aminopeptidase/acylaminoacyl peptidase
VNGAGLWGTSVIVVVALAGCQPETPTAQDAESIPVQPYRLRNITHSTSADGYATFSPDGARLAYSSVRQGNRDLYVMDLASGDTERLTRHPADDGGPAAWSPTGDQLFFRSKRDGGFYNIYQLELKSGTITRLTEAIGGEGYVDMSPDGGFIAFHSERDQVDGNRNLEIYVMDLATGVQRRITEQPDRRNGGADWFPDGKRLINIARSPTASSVQIINLAGEVLQEYAVTAAEDTFIGALSPDGKQFVFYSNREGDYHLYALELPDGQLTRISAGRAPFSTASFSPDGRYLAAQYDNATRADIVLIDLQHPVGCDYAEGRDLLYNARSRSELTAALALLKQSVVADGQFGPGRLMLAAAYARLSRSAEAREQLVALEGLTDQLHASETLLQRALQAKLDGNAKADVAAWQALVNADPGNRWAADELGAAQYGR